MKDKTHTAKYSVLTKLEEKRGETISGESLAAEIGVSRNAVWKAVCDLRSEGYKIDAKTNKGYSLSTDCNKLSVQGIRSYLPEQLKKNNILLYKEVDSTNNEAKRLIMESTPNKIPYNSVLLAESQTGGRGRRGKSFASPKADSIYMSFILKPALSIEDSLLITIMAAVCVCESIPPALDPKIKWINDIYINRKKVCGILTEAISGIESGELESIVLGIGININVPEDVFPGDIRDVAGSIPLEAGFRNRFAASLIENVLSGHKRLTAGESPIAKYDSYSMMHGAKVMVLKDGNTKAATAKSICDDGSLLVEYSDGTKSRLRSEEVSIRL